MATINIPDARALGALTQLPQLIVGNLDSATTQYEAGSITIRSSGYEIKIFGDDLHAETKEQLIAQATIRNVSLDYEGAHLADISGQFSLAALASSSDPVSFILGGADQVTGGAANDPFLKGGAGNDTLRGLAGDDVIYGNLNADVIYGNVGLDRIFGGQGSDTLYGGQDDDAIYGNIESDLIYGNLGSDKIFGGQGDDTIYGGQGFDTIYGGLGNDVMHGNLGRDVFVVDANSGVDLIFGFSAAGSPTGGPLGPHGDVLAIQGQSYSLVDTERGVDVNLSGGGTVVLVGLNLSDMGNGAIVTFV